MPIASKERVRAIIDTYSYKQRLALAQFIQKRFPLLQAGILEEKRRYHKSFCLYALDSSRGYGKVGTIVAKDLRGRGYAHFPSVEDFVKAYPIERE